MIILTGEVQSGKTTAAFELVEFLCEQNMKIAGILARGLWQDGVRSGFDLLNLTTGETAALARRTQQAKPQRLTNFDFFESGFAFAANALVSESCRDSDVVFVDEIGKLELAGKGLAPLLPTLLEIDRAEHVWIVRRHLVAEVCRAWRLDDPAVIDIERQQDYLERLKLLFLADLNQ